MREKLAGVLAAVMLLGAPVTAFADDFDATISVVRDESSITVTLPDNEAVYESGNITLTIPFDGDWAYASVKHEDGKTVVVAVTEEGITFPVTLGGTYTITESDGKNPDAGDHEENTENSGSGVSSGGSSSSPQYTVSVGKDTANGTVTVSPKSAAKGKKVTITVTPDAGYELEKLSVTDKTGKEIPVSAHADGTYSFIMPGGKVSIEARFKAVEVVQLPFVDVGEGHFFYNEIAWAYKMGYMNGKTWDTFQPAGVVSRQQVWMILARMSGAAPENMAAARAWAISNGISDGSNPGAAVTRQQLVTLLWRYAQMMGYDVSAGEDTNILSYNDVSSVSEYAIPTMQWACSEGIVTGTANGNLNPGSTATRAQFSAILYRFVG